MTSALAVTALAPLLAVSGCHDVEGAASNTAGQLNEREKRNNEVTDVLDSLPKDKKP
jgi:hypothetical protein